MTKRNGRYVKRDVAIDPYLNLAIAIIVDAMRTASGQSTASRAGRIESRQWLRSEMCQRWAWVCGVDIEAALNHKDSLMKIEAIGETNESPK